MKYNLPKKEFIKFIFILFLLELFNIPIDESIKNLLKKIRVYLKPQGIKIKFYKELFENTIKNKTILIIEINYFHHECLPGFSKYFIDLGYNVDILLSKDGIDSFSFFKDVENITLFIFNAQNQIYLCYKNLSTIIKKYDFVLLQTTNSDKGILFNNLGLTSINNSFFVFHTLNNINILNYSNYLAQNRIFTLGNFSRGLQVNPLFFGDIKIKNKNIKTRFFLTSTFQRNYRYLVSAAEKLKSENFNFELIIIGRTYDFNLKHIPKHLYNNFIFKYRVSYRKLYQAVESSDFILIPLDPNNESDLKYRTIQASGSIQLAYGFLKPVIINENFAQIYNLNSENSLIYNDNNIYNSMREAIILDNKKYTILQNNLNKCAKEVYRTSLNNIKKAFNK